MASACLEVRSSGGQLAAAAEDNSQAEKQQLDDSRDGGSTPVGPVGADGLASKSSVFSLQFWVSKGSPTNQNMLMLRTINPHLGLPNHNEDWLAARFRDVVLPVRSSCMKRLKGHTEFLKRCVEHPTLGVPGLVNFVDARTRWVDDQVKGALADGITQVVIVAAGYDSRAYRFGQPGVRFYEVDLPSASLAKKKLVGKVLPADQRASVSLVAADLSELSLYEVLTKTTFDPDQPTMFTVEGLIYYLQPQAVSSLFQNISRLAAPGSRMCFDYLNADALRGQKWYVGFNACAQMVANKGEPFVSGFYPSSAAMKTYLEQYGFTVDEMLTAAGLCGKLLPHLEWSDEQPPMCPFYGYVAGVKVATSVPDKDAA